MHADSSSKRMDEKHLITHRLQLPLPDLAGLLSQARSLALAHCIATHLHTSPDNKVCKLAVAL